MPGLIDIYHKVPYPLKVVMASARGYYLKAWRYGPDHEQQVDAILNRDFWPGDAWARWREDRLAIVLERAVTQVPYYREYWKSRRNSGGQNSWRDLENWPILEKDEIKNNPRAFLADNISPRQMYHEHTSGTTGKSLDLWWSRETVRKWYALFEARGRRWYGVSKNDRWAILGGQLVTSAARRKPPFWVWNQALNQLYLSAYHLAPELIPRYLEALEKHRIRYLWGYTSALYALAQGALAQGASQLNIMVALTNAEPLEGYQRSLIEEAFKCPVRETYGMAEIVAAASECESGNLHLWPEAGIVEVLDGERRLPAGQAGDLVCTGLLNVDMPLIRYRVGDWGSLAPDNHTCDCQRTLPLLSSIEGRSDDLLYTVDGRSIGRMDPVFKAALPIREAQIVQERLDTVRVRYVPLPEFKKEDEQSLINGIQARMGKIKVVLEEIPRVPREPNGKFRAVINQVPEAEIQQLKRLN